MSVNRKKKVTRTTPLNSEEVAMKQPRISEFLSDNANKESTRSSAPSCPDAEKTSNLSPQVEKVPLLKEPVSEAEGTAKVTKVVFGCETEYHFNSPCGASESK